MGPHTIITTILLDVMIGEILTDSLLRSQKTWHPSDTHNYCIWLYHDKEWAQIIMTWILCSKSFFGTIHIPSFTKKLPCWCPCWCQVRQPTPPTFGWCKVPPPRSTSGYLQHHHGWHRWNWIAPEGLWPVTTVMTCDDCDEVDVRSRGWTMIFRRLCNHELPNFHRNVMSKHIQTWWTNIFILVMIYNIPRCSHSRWNMMKTSLDIT